MSDALNCDDFKKTAQQLLGYAGAIKQIEENMFEAEQNRAKKVLSRCNVS